MSACIVSTKKSNPEDEREIHGLGEFKFNILRDLMLSSSKDSDPLQSCVFVFSVAGMGLDQI